MYQEGRIVRAPVMATRDVFNRKRQRRMDTANLLSCESVAGRDVARLQTASEPLSPLCRRAVREAFRANAPARHPLQAIIADRSRGIEALRHISLIDNVALLGRVSPHTGEAIGL